MTTVLYVRQLNDGVLSGEEAEVAPHYDGQPAAELLERKRVSHRDKGWTVEETELGFHAWKFYEGWGRKDRWFEVR
jgi:hypothetical protein